jgi:hypothetical protein
VCIYIYIFFVGRRSDPHLMLLGTSGLGRGQPRDWDLGTGTSGLGRGQPREPRGTRTASGSGTSGPRSGTRKNGGCLRARDRSPTTQRRGRFTFHSGVAACSGVAALRLTAAWPLAAAWPLELYSGVAAFSAAWPLYISTAALPLGERHGRFISGMAALRTATAAAD